MPLEMVPVSGPWITQKEIDYVNDAVTNAWYGNANIYHQRFEKAFAEYSGVKYALALPSCTSAIHLSLAALGIKPGDEVVVPDLTWIASAAPVSYLGATPVFADVDEKTWCLSPESLGECITARTRAVIAVDLYGNMPPLDEIRSIAEQNNMVFIEDAAQAIGSEYKSRKAGSFGDTGVFSFHGSKTLTTGEGGMLITNNEAVYRRCLLLRDHGRQPEGRCFWNLEVAYKYKMSTLQAALGLAQLERIDELVDRKRQIFSWYEEELRSCPGITLNRQAPQTKNSYWMVTVVIDPQLGLEKDHVLQQMREHKIDGRPFFYPLSMLPAYQGSEQAVKAQNRNKVSYRISPYGINLPSAPLLTRSNIRYICQVLKQQVLGVRNE